MNIEDNLEKVLKELNGTIRKYETQQEFMNAMGELNYQQSLLCAPLRDDEDLINGQRHEIEMQVQKLRLQALELKSQWHQVEEKRLTVGRAFSDLKHRLIVLNPKDELSQEG